jgi:hypothetical protein
MSRLLGSARLGAAEVEVTGCGSGIRFKPKWTPLNSRGYDPKEDTFEVVTDEVDH